MLNAKKGIASKQLMRDTGISYKTAWYVSMRVRCAMVQENEEMQNIVEMDEAYIGGKPRKTNEKQNANEPNLFKITNKRGRGTKKVPIVGIVERNGNVVLKVIEKLTSKNLMAMLKENVRTESTILITDNYKGYKKFDQIIEHLVIDHSKEFSRGDRKSVV
jgi:predicted metal-dependent hydrolase